MLFGLLCIFIFFYFVRPLEWVGGLAGSQLFQVLGVLSLLVLANERLSNRIRFFRFRSDLMMAGFCAAIVLSNLSNGNIGVMVQSVKTFIPVVAGYLLVAYSLNSPKRVRIFVFLLIGLAVFLSVEAVLEVSTGSGHGGIEPVFGNGPVVDGVALKVPRVRWYGVFNDPNDLALALVMAVPFLIDMLLNRIFLPPLLCLPILLYGIYLTNSRGAIVSLLASVFSYSVMRYKSTKGVLLGVVIAIVLFFFGPSRIADVSSSGESAYGRVEAWYQGFQMFQSRPIFGVGKDMFTDFHRLTAHNSYVLVLSELGLVGSFFFVGMFYYPLLWARKEMKAPLGRHAPAASFQFAIIASLIGIMVGMFFLSRAYTMIPYILIALISASLNHVSATADDTDVLAAPFKGVFCITCFQTVFLYGIMNILL